MKEINILIPLVTGLIAGILLSTLLYVLIVGIEEKDNSSSIVAKDCYWATKYILYPVETTKHFEGKDYSEIYIYECNKGMNENWDKIMGEI